MKPPVSSYAPRAAYSKTTDGGKTFTLSRASPVAYPGTNLTAHFRAITFGSGARGWAGNLGPGSYDASVNDTNIVGHQFSFDFATEPYESYTVQWATNLATPTWVNQTNFAGNGSTNAILLPLLNGSPQYFRVSRP